VECPSGSSSQSRPPTRSGHFSKNRKWLSWKIHTSNSHSSYFCVGPIQYVHCCEPLQYNFCEGVDPRRIDAYVTPCMCRTRVTLHTGWRNSRCGNVTDGLHNDDVRMQKRCPTRDDDNDFSSRQRLRRVVVPSTADTKESPRDRLVPRS